VTGWLLSGSTPSARRALSSVSASPFATLDAERSGVAAFGIVRAADEAPNLPSLRLSRPAAQPGQRRGSLPSCSRGRNAGRVSSSSAAITWVIVSSLVPATAKARTAPELAQHLLPIDAPARDLVELVLEIGG